MTEKEYMLTRDMGNWLFYAMYTLGMKKKKLFSCGIIKTMLVKN